VASSSTRPAHQDGYYNLWRGFACEPIAGSWDKLKNHIHEIICAGNKILFEYLLDWIARLFQQPSLPGEVAIVLKGEEGSGKGILCRAVIDILGQHGLHITSSDHLVGKFNAHLRDCIALFADEAFFAGDRQHIGRLKALITEPSIAIEGKGRDVVFVKNRLHVMMAANDDWVIPAGPRAGSKAA
jgi:phage/plasmid-associated DNA primase